MLTLLCTYVVFMSYSSIFFQVRDSRTDWELQVNQPIAGNYYPVCFFCKASQVTISLYIFFLSHILLESIRQSSC
jgi:hypothetical protein